MYRIIGNSSVKIKQLLIKFMFVKYQIARHIPTALGWHKCVYGPSTMLITTSLLK